MIAAAQISFVSLILPQNSYDFMYKSSLYTSTNKFLNPVKIPSEPEEDE